MNSIVDQVFNDYMRKQLSKQQISPQKNDSYIKNNGSQKQQCDSNNKENIIKKRILTIQEPSNESMKQSKDNSMLDVFNKTFCTQLELRKQRSTTYNNQQQQNIQLFRANNQSSKNDTEQNNFHTINAIQDQYFQLKPRISLLKSQKTLFEQQNINNSSNLRIQNLNKITIIKKCDTERSNIKVNNTNNTLDGIEQQQVVINTYQKQFVKQQNFNNKEENSQKQQIQQGIQNKDNQLEQSKFFLKRQYKGVQENTNNLQKSNLFQKFFDTTRIKLQNQQNPQTNIIERFSNKEIQQLSENDIDKQVKPIKHPTLNELNTSQLRDFSEDKNCLNRQKNILVKKRSFLKLESNETSMNFIKDDTQNGIVQKIPSSNKLINDNKQILHPILVKKFSQDDFGFEKMNNNLSEVFSPKLKNHDIFNNNSSSSSIPTKLRSITNHNQASTQFLTSSQRVLMQKRIYSEEHKFKNSISMFPVEIEDFQFVKDLGTGSYAVVRYAIHKKTNFQVAIKSYDKRKLQDPQKKQNVDREIKILQGLSHKHIIKLYKVVECKENLNLIMEYSYSFPLNLYLKTKSLKRLHEIEAKLIFRQLVEAVMYIHKKGVIHRDIKLENILINQERKVKLIDFGFSIVASSQSKLSMFCGTPAYMAPEIICKKGYTFGVDIWALGILLHKLLTGAFPFTGKDNKQLYRNIIKCEIDYPMYISPSAKNLLQSILIEDPSKRKTLEEVFIN